MWNIVSVSCKVNESPDFLSGVDSYVKEHQDHWVPKRPLSPAVELYAQDVTLQKASWHCCVSSRGSLDRNSSCALVYLLPSALSGPYFGVLCDLGLDREKYSLAALLASLSWSSCSYIDYFDFRNMITLSKQFWWTVFARAALLVRQSFFRISGSLPSMDLVTNGFFMASALPSSFKS